MALRLEPIRKPLNFFTCSVYIKTCEMRVLPKHGKRDCYQMQSPSPNMVTKVKILSDAESKGNHVMSYVDNIQYEFIGRH